MKRRSGLMIAIGACACLATTPSAQSGSTNWDAKFRELPQPSNIRASMERLSARPHHVGSPYDKDNAEWLLARFKEWGWDAEIEVFSVLFPTPKERVLELLEPTRFTAKLEEPALPGDPTTSQQDEQLPTYNAYSIDGDVTGPLVYVNYGRPEDYDVLERYGISVKGAIVVARYGESWRGIKPKVAAEHGAVGCLIYSDPKDDGFGAGEVFPNGPMRPRDGAQRGSVMDMPVYPGDPLTPGVGATADAKRLAIKDATTLTKIPVMPISYADAQPLLASLTGAVVPAELARRTADHLSLRPRRRPRAPEARLQLGSEAALRRHRPAARIDVSRSVGHPRQSPRRLGERRRGSGERHVGHAGGSARARRTAQAGMGAEAHDRLLRVGR